jgi:O-methyltransferase involved in polyketide biosynthesis
MTRSDADSWDVASSVGATATMVRGTRAGEQGRGVQDERNDGDRGDALRSVWQEHGFDVTFADLFYPGDRNPVVECLSEQGWQVSSRSSRPDVFRDYGKQFPDTDELAPLRNSLAIIATRK